MKDEARLTPEVLGIRRPPRPPLRVGLAMAEGERFPSEAQEAYARLCAALRKANENFWQGGKSSFDLGSSEHED